MPVEAIFSDDHGIYIIETVYLKKETADNKCYNKHQIWCWNCQGCLVPICKFRCRCVEWPFMVPQ